MGSGATLFFDVITAVFVILTLIVALIVISVAAGTMDPPFLAPEATLIPPTQAVLPTLTPSPGPGMELTPDLTLTPEAPASQ